MDTIKPAWAHQRSGTNMILAGRSCLLHWDMGCGKTRSVIDAIRLGHIYKRILIVAPLSVVPVWPTEFDKYAPGLIENVVPLDAGTITARAGRLLAMIDRWDTDLVAVVNYDVVFRKPMYDALRSCAWDLLVLDEVHKIKNSRGKTSKALRLLGKQSRQRVGLTGTLMPHSPTDVWAQFDFIRPSVFGRSFVQFRSHYCVMGGWQGKEVQGFKNQEEMAEKIGTVTDRVKKADVLDLPKSVHEARYLDLPAAARSLYDRLYEDLETDVQKGTVTTANALVRLLRLQQVTSGYVTTDGGDDEELHTEKLKALREILDDLAPDERVVVFCRFRHDLRSVLAAGHESGRGYFELSGAHKQLPEWRRSSGGVLGAQVQAGSLGVDMTAASYAVYFSLGFSLGEYEQSLARLDRPGQTRSVTNLHLIVRRTVDEKVYWALQHKRDVVQSILDQVPKKKQEVVA